MKSWREPLVILGILAVLLTAIGLVWDGHKFSVQQQQKAASPQAYQLKMEITDPPPKPPAAGYELRILTDSHKPQNPPQYDAVYERQAPDGTWAEYKRERLKMPESK